MSQLYGCSLIFENTNSMRIPNRYGDSFHFGKEGGKEVEAVNGVHLTRENLDSSFVIFVAFCSIRIARSSIQATNLQFFGFHVGHHVGQMVKMLADMMADMKILKMPINQGFFRTIESSWPT
jgi:hypothetical protein